MTKGFIEESYDWDNDIMEITQRVVYEMDEARISNIADHFKVDLSEIRKYIEMKSQQKSKPVTNADLIRGMTDKELAEKIVMCRNADIFRKTVLGTRMNTIEEWLDWLKQEVQKHE